MIIPAILGTPRAAIWFHSGFSVCGGPAWTEPFFLIVADFDAGLFSVVPNDKAVSVKVIAA